MKVIDKAIPLIHGGSPIRPDGKGCLLLREEKDNAKQSLVVFTEWEGTQHNIDTQALQALEKKKDNKEQGPKLVSTLWYMPLILPSWWDGSVAHAGLKRDKLTYAIDTLQKTIPVSAGLKALAATDKKIGSLHYDFAGPVSVKVVPFPEDKSVDPKGKRKFIKVVVVNHQTGTEQILFDKMPGDYFGGSFGLMSPNGQYLYLCLFLVSAQQTVPTTMAVINQQGKLVSKIEIEQ
jgi:hypothetical protein